MNDENAMPVVLSRHPMNDTADAVEREYRKANIAMLKASLASRKPASREANEAVGAGALQEPEKGALAPETLPPATPSPSSPRDLGHGKPRVS